MGDEPCGSSDQIMPWLAFCRYCCNSLRPVFGSRLGRALFSDFMKCFTHGSMLVPPKSVTAMALALCLACWAFRVPTMPRLSKQIAVTLISGDPTRHNCVMFNLLYPQHLLRLASEWLPSSGLRSLWRQWVDRLCSSTADNVISCNLC